MQQLPMITLNYYAMLAAFVAAFAFGGLWYGPILGKTWAGLMGMDMTKKPEPGVMKRAFILQIIGLCLTIYVLAHILQVWRPSVWNAGPDQGPDWMWGATGAFFTWIGFYVPLQLNKVSWEMRPWKLFFINIGHDFINLMIMSMILAYWR